MRVLRGGRHESGRRLDEQGYPRVAGKAGRSVQREWDSLWPWKKSCFSHGAVGGRAELGVEEGSTPGQEGGGGKSG